MLSTSLHEKLTKRHSLPLDRLGNLGDLLRWLNTLRRNLLGSLLDLNRRLLLGCWCSCLLAHGLRLRSRRRLLLHHLELLLLLLVVLHSDELELLSFGER